MTRHVLGIIAGVALLGLAIVLLMDQAREQALPGPCAWRCVDAMEMETASGEVFCSCVEEHLSGWALPEATVVATAALGGGSDGR